MINRISAAFVILAAFATVVSGQVSTTPVEGLHTPLKRVIAFVNCTVVPEPGKVIDSAVIIVRNDRIVSVGSNTSIPSSADVRDLKGAWVYAAFVEPYADVKDFSTKESTSSNAASGFDEEDPGPDAPKQQGARHWNQAVRPEREPLDALRISSDVATSWQKRGYGAACVSSHDGIFSGYASTVAIREGSGGELALTQHVSQSLDFSKGSSKTPYPSSLMGCIALVRQTFMDAQWYGTSSRLRNVPTAEDPEANISVAALYNAVTAGIPFVARTYDEHDIGRWQAIATEARIPLIIVGTGKEYRRLATIAASKPRLILPLELPKVPDVRNVLTARTVPLTDLIHWYWAADNPRLLDSAGCEFAFTTNGLKDKAATLSTVRTFVERGLDSSNALAALTTIPASYAGISDVAGTIAPNKLASFVVMSGPLFNTKSTILYMVVGGSQTAINPPPPVDIRGTWSLTTAGIRVPMKVAIAGTAVNPTITTTSDSTSVPSTIDVFNNQVALSFTLDSIRMPGTVRGTAQADSILMQGTIVMQDGSTQPLVLHRDKPFTTPAPTGKTKPTTRRALPPTMPLGPFGYDTLPPVADVVFTHATVWTNGAQGILTDADVAIAGGRITAVGKGLKGIRTIDCKGKHITAGIIDEHSHIAISRGVNEGTAAVTTEVRIGDVLNPDDVNIYRQLAGGVTASHLLHGSANPMGGQLQFIRLRWGADAEGLKQQGTKPTVKFALGENVKQSNWGDRYTVRYPQTRMGVEEIMRDAFAAAKEYADKRDQASVGGTPVRRDLRMDALVEILKGQRNIHCHSYKASEILMLIRLAEEFGFTVGTFTHVLEGYKVASEIKKHGAHANTFADWWAYKFEVYDAIPQNPAIMHEQGIVVGVNSDDAEMARRLNQEAAKSVSYGGVSEEEAMKFATLNAAIQMELQNSMGSVEVGKDADIVVWSGNPLSNLSRPERTYVEGRELFSLETDAKLRKRDAELRAFLEQEALKAIAGGQSTSASSSASPREYHCDTIEDEMSGQHTAK